MEFEAKDGSNVAIGLIDELVSRNLVECKEVEFRTINNRMFIDFITNDESEETTFTRLLRGDQATMNKRRYSLVRVDPADIIEFDVRTLNIENKNVSLAFIHVASFWRQKLILPYGFPHLSYETFPELRTDWTAFHTFM